MDDNRALIMIVDDNIANLKVAKNALAQSYDVFTVLSAAKMFDMLQRNKPSLILLDIDMPEMDGFEVIKLLKAEPSTQDIPVIFLTGRGEPENEVKGLHLGAIDYISKPFSPQILDRRVELHLSLADQKEQLREQAKELDAHVKEIEYFNRNLQEMVDEKTSEILRLQNAILRIMADMVESRDDATGGHIWRTQFFLRALINAIKSMGVYQDQMSDWDVDLMLESSQLHDVGKIAIPDSILKKPGRLTPEEFGIMKTHVAHGIRIIEHIEDEASSTDFLRYAKIFASTHHERWDGSGYPSGLAGHDIPLPGRLMAIVDVYDALTSDRPYKRAISHPEAVKIIHDGSGSHFDPVLVDVLEKIAEQFASPAYSTQYPQQLSRMNRNSE
ncbi:MAG: response regulator [Holophagaceae bacterium]|nr:response regulator [Holophagaceae bacterium]